MEAGDGTEGGGRLEGDGVGGIWTLQDLMVILSAKKVDMRWLLPDEINPLGQARDIGKTRPFSQPRIPFRLSFGFPRE